MELAPAAMLWHLGIGSDADDFYHCPLILPLPEAMDGFNQSKIEGYQYDEHRK